MGISNPSDFLGDLTLYCACASDMTHFVYACAVLNGLQEFGSLLGFFAANGNLWVVNALLGVFPVDAIIRKAPLSRLTALHWATLSGRPDVLTALLYALAQDRSLFYDYLKEAESVSRKGVSKYL